MRAWLIAALIATLPTVLPAQPHARAALLELRQKLLRHDWQGLDQALDDRRIRGDDESAVEFRYVFAFDAFVSSDSALQQHLDSWVAAEPTSAQARAARGLYFLRMASAAKERDDDAHPSRAIEREVSRWVALANWDADAAARIDPAEFMGHVLRLGMIPFDGDERETRKALRTAVQLRPSTLHARALYIETLTPRFENPPRRMIAFADSAQALAKVNPRLRVLQGMSDFERGRDFAVRERHDSSIAAFTRAIARGDYWQFRYERGMEYYRIDSLSKALIDLNRALAERPAHVASIVGRALTFAHLARTKAGTEHADLLRRAESDVHAAATFDPTDSDVRGILNGTPPPGGVTPAPLRAPELPIAAATPLDRPADLLALRRLLVERDFGRLDSALAERRADARAHPARESRYLYAFDVFDDPEPALRAPLDEWVARDSMRATAYAARARYLVRRGWFARSEKTADKVGRAQWDEMREWLRLAGRDAVRAARLDSTDIAPHLAMLDAMMLDGSDELSLAVVRDAMKRQPSSMLIRARYMYSLRPAWGGSIEELERFANAQQPDAVGNARMETLLGLADLERGDDLAEDDQPQAAIAAYTRALTHGRFWSFYYKRARVYHELRELDRAMSDLERAVAERPAEPSALAWRAMLGAELASDREGRQKSDLLLRAREDLRLAATFDPTDDDVVWVQRNYPEIASQPARSAAKRR